MSHWEGTDADPYDMDPREVLSQYSVEWVALRKSYNELKKKLADVQRELALLDQRLKRGEISEEEHMQLYRETWMKSTELVQVKREVEARLFEIQRRIRATNQVIQEQEAERERRERIEQEKANAMIEWMSLRQGFDIVMKKRREINAEMDRLELLRREGKVSEEEYRQQHIEHVKALAELRILESDIQRRLSELLEIIKA